MSWRWRVLVLGLLALVGVAAVHDPTVERGLYDREASTWLAAASLAHDADLRLDTEDLDRYRETWQRPPDQIRLVTGEVAGPRVLAEPFWTSLLLAPAARLAPDRGIVALQALLLAVVLLWATRRLARHRGDELPLWSFVWVFGSVAFAGVFRPLPEVVALVAVVAAFALLEESEEAGADVPPDIWGERPASQPGSALRLLAAGALTGIAVELHPLYFLLVVPLGLLPARGLRWRRFLLLVMGVAVALIPVVWSAGASTGSPSPWPTVVESYAPAGGLPVGESVAAEAVGEQHLMRPMRGTDRFSPSLWGWNALYLLGGRDIGLLLYFLPIVLALGMAGSGVGRGWIVGCAGAVLVGFMLLDPFDLYAGAAGLANGRFLPLYGAFLFLPARAPRRWLLAGVLALSGVLLWPLWIGAAAFPLADAGTYRHVAPLTARYLPFETTQERLPGGEWVEFAGARARPLGGTVWQRPGGQVFELVAGRRGELLLAHRSQLAAALLSFGRAAPSDIQVSGGTPGPTIFRPDGGVDLRVELGAARRTHPMWWGAGEYALYRLEVRLPEEPPGPLAIGIAVETVD